MPERIQLRRSKGWRMPPNTVKVDRATKWGNPFHMHSDGYPYAPEMAVKSFRAHLKDCGEWWPTMEKAARVEQPPTTVDDVRSELRGKNLACWCALDKPCHADVLLEIANS